MKNLIQLYPQPAGERPLIGTYLTQNLRPIAAEKARPFVYTNYVVSMDGRIAVYSPELDRMTVPDTLANARDWRLFQELGFQADVIVCNTTYVQDVADGRLGEIMGMDAERFADLRQWRLDQGLQPLPDTAIVSKSLNVTIAPHLVADGRRVVVFTSADSDPVKRAALQDQGAEVYVVGESSVDGRLMVDQLAACGYKAVYNVSGAKILHIFVAAGVLDRLYVTYAHRMIGGAPFVPLLEGPLLETPLDLQLREIYLDLYALDGQGQIFLSYDCG